MKVKTKKIIISSIIMIIFLIIISSIMPNEIYAVETNDVLVNEVESKLVEIKQNQASSLEDFKVKYGTDIYGMVGYVLNLIRIYSIPLCFLGIAIGAVHKYIIGIRKLDTLEKGFGLIVTFVTLLIICQILPLLFLVFVKFGRG